MSDISILVLGVGAVAGPCVDYLLRNPRNKITVASRSLENARKLAAGRANVEAIKLDVADLPSLEERVAANDIVISLVPYAHHADVIRAAIQGKTNVVTTSYTSPAMRELEADVKQAGIVVLNEVGVDPGVDHLYAIKTINEVHSKGGKIKEFHSYCGGLPAPEAANNPLKFKFSWSPRGALLSQYNSAEFLQDGKVVEIPRDELMSHAQPRFVTDGYSFVGYPNRNSLPFQEFYGIPEAQTVVRGSLRYEGNPAVFRALVQMGWIDTEPKAWLKDGLTWAQIQSHLIGATSFDEKSITERMDEICTFSDVSERERIISSLHWLGVLSDEVAEVYRNPIDTLCGRLSKTMSFGPGERDLVMLQHTFIVEWKDGTNETITSTLELLGDPNGYSGMSKSVGVTCGIATQLLVDGFPAMNRPGLLAPYTPEICDPIRNLLQLEDIEMVERRFKPQSKIEQD